MTHVQQADQKGCGVACVATVCGMSYQLAKDHALETKTWRASYGMNGGMMQRLLRHLGTPVHRITMGRVPGYPVPGRTAIVKVTAKQAGKKRPWAHWVVWQQGKVWDPGYGILWDGNGTGVDGMRLYLASVKQPGVDVRSIKTGRWHWV